jgi:hypothetical protein
MSFLRTVVQEGRPFWAQRQPPGEDDVWHLWGDPDNPCRPGGRYVRARATLKRPIAKRLCRRCDEHWHKTPPPEDLGPVVYLKQTVGLWAGRRFHAHGCRYLGDRRPRRVPRRVAEAIGLTGCCTCNPKEARRA